MTVIRDLLDRQLGRVTMYRLITIVLGMLAAIYLAYSASGIIEGISVRHELISLVVLLAASYGSNQVFGRLWKIKPHNESSVITGLLLFFLFVPMFTTDLESYAWLAGAAVLANASKYVLAWRGRHIFNPAAAGAFLVFVAQQAVSREGQTLAIWQVGATDKMLPVRGAWRVPRAVAHSPTRRRAAVHRPRCRPDRPRSRPPRC